MARLHTRRQPVLGLVTALSIAIGGSLGALAPPPSALAAAPLAPVATKQPAWDGSIDLYRTGVFTTQKSWLWCTAAGVQIVRNIGERDQDHATSAQRTYFAWMRRHNRYDLPESAGVDPAGWTAGLRHFVDDRYRLVASKTFDAALRSATARLRETGLPVALTVANGGHGWILTGFSATADPSRTADYKVTAVRLVGPLYGRQSRNGYDMKPNTSLTPKELRRFFTPWRYAPKRMIWDGKYVSIQPVPRKATPAPASIAAPAASAPAPAAAAASTPTAVTTAPSPAAVLAPPSRPVATLPAAATSIAETTPLPVAAPAEGGPAESASTSYAGLAPLMIAAGGLALAVAVLMAARQARDRRGRSSRIRE